MLRKLDYVGERQATRARRRGSDERRATREVALNGVAAMDRNRVIIHPRFIHYFTLG